MTHLVLLFQLQAQISPNAAASEVGWVFWVSELLAAVAYLCVAPLLFYLTVKRDDLQRRIVLLLFGVMALLAASVHVINLVGTREWLPVLLIVKLVLGVAAVVTAFLLYKAIPGLLAIPSQIRLQRANQELLEQVQEREKAQAALRETQEELERRVQQRSRQLNAANKDLEREIDTRKRTEKQLISKNYELVRLNADLDDFVYYASRDLKGPVLNVAGLVQVIKEELPPNNPALGDLFMRLDNSVSQINRKLNNLAEVSRIQRPVDQGRLEMVSFSEVLAAVKTQLQALIQTANAEITADFSGAPAVYFSRENLHSLLYHLLTNALKYREPSRPTRVALTSQLQERSIVLAVRDNGIGMDLERHGPQLFSLFRRFHDHVEGSGLGLYIIKRIMDNHRGKVKVQSTLGEGTTFSLYFVPHVKDTSNKA
ncbi:sensor histidine kinase [Rufibacter ruber]|uniref:sensor histidine kinase n=1 Tax=Rufibacter ruber TaxID=1783499 RepID=UPI0009EE3F13|nr:HAMP domain-containing sensor histidine kinase [Rufibacter ruber]